MKKGHTFCIISKDEKIVSWIQFPGGDDSGCNNRNSGHTGLSKFGRPTAALMTK